MKNMSWLSVLFVVSIYYIKFVNSDNILVVLPVPARSHFASFQAVLEELVKRDHNLTIISLYKLSKNFEKNYTQIDVSHIGADKVGISFAEMRKQGRLENLIFSNDRLIQHTEMVLNDSQVQHLLHSQDTKFNLVIVELFHVDVYFAFGYHFNAPVIGISVQNVISIYQWITRNPMSPSYIPHMNLPLTDKMSFQERLWNTLFTTSFVFYHQFISLPKCQSIVEQYFPFQDSNDIPKLETMMKNISLILVNDHFTLGYPVPSYPNVIQIAGTHINEPQPLPANLQKFMDDAKEGIIYISMGSLIRLEDIDSMGDIIISVAKRLPQKVIFKWNREIMPPKPDNIWIEKWAPQTGILNHQNCRLFITHGGIHSLIESVNYSVPLVGIPFFSDQLHNMALVEYLGIGFGLNINFTEDQLSTAIHQVLSDPKYSTNMKKISQTFKDRPLPLRDTAIYWIEYVIRHKGAGHFRSAAADLPFHQFLLLDVVAFILTIVCSVIILTYYFSKKCLMFVFNSKPSTDHKKES